tara:strand:+ start:310 stop:555 length:246 start_codon:yes stop_codon:yes gene_type:complete
MSDFFNEKPQNTYKSILNIGTSNNQTIDGTVRNIEDGRGNASALSLSATEVEVARLLVDSIIIDNNRISGAVMDGGSFDGT